MIAQRSQTRDGITLRADIFRLSGAGYRLALSISGHDYGLHNVADQAALHGLLAKVRDLNLPLLSVRRIDQQETPCPDHAADSES